MIRSAYLQTAAYGTAQRFRAFEYAVTLFSAILHTASAMLATLPRRHRLVSRKRKPSVCAQGLRRTGGLDKNLPYLNGYEINQKN